MGGGYGETQLGGATWFLKVLFTVSVVFFIIQKISDFIKSKIDPCIVQCLAAFILLMLGWYLPKMGIDNYFKLHTCASVYFIYVAGWMARKKDLMGWMHANKRNALACFSVSVVILLMMGKNITIAVNSNTYTNPAAFLCASLAGSLMCMSVAVILVEIKGRLGIVIGYFGKNSLMIMMLHFLSFKCITWIEVKWYHMPDYNLAAFPVLITEGVWRILYILTGILIPIVLKKLWNIARRME